MEVYTPSQHQHFWACFHGRGEKKKRLLWGPDLGVGPWKKPIWPNGSKWKWIILLMAEILHQLIGSLSHYLQGFIHPRWCRILAINSIIQKLIVCSSFKTLYILLHHFSPGHHRQWVCKTTFTQACQSSAVPASWCWNRVGENQWALKRNQKGTWCSFTPGKVWQGEHRHSATAVSEFGSPSCPYGLYCWWKKSC